MSSWRDRLKSGLPRLAVVAHDLAMVWLVWQALHKLRFGITATPPPLPLWSTEIALVLLAQGLVFWQVGLYRGLWRFAGVPDLWNIFKACMLGLFAIVLGLFLYNRVEQVPRTVLVLYPLVLMGMLGAPRLLYRAWKDSRIDSANAVSVRILILGAGRAGEALVRDLRRFGTYHPVGFLDDAARLRGSKVQGVPVLGRVDDVAEIARETAAKLLVIAMPSADANAMQRIVMACERTGVPFRMVPRLQDVLEGRSLPGELKEVAIEDLLGRKPVLPDWKAIRGWLGARSVLVTGAGGSIGSELCRQCARHGAGRIALIEIDELALVTTETALRRDFPDVEFIPILGDCGDKAVIEYALKLAEPDAAFHAAAYKQVPLLEAQLREAVRNNVLATETVARACRAAGVGTFVLISTDKAVDPVNVLGATKRLAEMTCTSLADQRKTRFVTVRFGNVLDSAGSVVPLFREQIRSGGPVTVTDPEVTRFFMTIPEACQLILQASAIGTHEAIYTLDMGEPVPIRLLAEQMIRLAGKQPGRDVAIVYTGLRPGEKLHETLFHADERYRPTVHPKILQAEPRDVSTSALEHSLQQLREASIRYDRDALAVLLRIAVPEFHPVGEHPDYKESATVVAFPARNARKI
ncbi:polysaccharide biosynthesis protein [Lysobacter capsici]|jgi:FlaA1/EpsC-like NDP-sugar epimerase|uniref:UDP-N-acetylglucosamine 4,6-dehydratase n=1 Tax=Lysobacter capsici AZ78 TaxID=1444315 RepID=A0A108U648_9GAMM|nr:nucleoside-diphosphate sugar epimerase/dehydratase [Lysobacter capsici]ATE71705.1 polysaccharide biosynthesis protein [Lysobacter capsici]KWS03257.1 UDP-N-acetylglucosamine 4,6-dehydratase [Lysobacter capsici AZ78]UOF17025.1 polysaccharide biosynthesis protein [Lysobacter capsici]WND82729.1 nucleoside-diphosphate sugar epimerase/dehydratase [Lysobacter capsici]WND87927.1 nucleoside-diphosphate sugar epimerase/dehydratase [Lysobacter capsici]